MQDKIFQLQRTIIHTTATRPRLALFPGPLWTRQFSDEVLSSDKDIVYTLHDYNIIDQTLLYRNFTNLFHVNSCRTVHFVFWCFEQVSLFWGYTDDLDQFLGSV